jgi:hypothetical protein
MSVQTSHPPASFAKRVVALFLDFLTIFFSGAYFIGWLTGGLRADGVDLSGAPGLVFLALIGAYFYVGWKFAGGTIWDRILGIARPQPY